MERAVNLADLTKYVPRGTGGLGSPVMLLLGDILTGEVVQCSGDRWDEMGILIREDVSDERWAAIKGLLRKGWAGAGVTARKWELRLYEAAHKESKTWKRV